MKKILICEDEDSIRSFVVVCLKRAGYTVVEAADGEEALARYDAVLAGLDGRICQAMRSGLPPVEYPKVEELREANVLARKILRLTVRVDV